MVTETPEPTVTQHDRNLTIAGWRRKGGRGNSAAKVTARDAAFLLTAMLGSDKVKDSVETAARYADTIEHGERKKSPGRAGPYAQLKVPALDALAPGHSFVDALEALITLAMDETFDREIGADRNSCVVSVEWPRTVGRISVQPSRDTGRELGFVQTLYMRSAGGAERGVIERSARIYSMPIRYIGALLGDRLDKLPPLMRPV